MKAISESIGEHISAIDKISDVEELVPYFRSAIGMQESEQFCVVFLD